MRIALLTTKAEILEMGLIIHSGFPIVDYQNGEIETRSFLIPFIDCHVMKNSIGDYSVLDQLALFESEDKGIFLAPSREWDRYALTLVELGDFRRFKAKNSDEAPQMIRRISFGEDFPLSNIYAIILEAGVTHIFSGVREDGSTKEYKFAYDYEEANVSFLF